MIENQSCHNLETHQQVAFAHFQKWKHKFWQVVDISENCCPVWQAWNEFQQALLRFLINERELFLEIVYARVKSRAHEPRKWGIIEWQLKNWFPNHWPVLVRIWSKFLQYWQKSCDWNRRTDLKVRYETVKCKKLGLKQVETYFKFLSKIIGGFHWCGTFKLSLFTFLRKFRYCRTDFCEICQFD